MVERSTVNRMVVGSSPTIPANFIWIYNNFRCNIEYGNSHSKSI